MLRKYFKQKISQPARDKGWRLGEKFGKTLIPGILFLNKHFNAIRKKAEKWPRLSVALLLLIIILNTVIAVNFAYQRNKAVSKKEGSNSASQLLKSPKPIDMTILNQPSPDINRLKAIRDSLQFYKNKSKLEPQDSIAVMELLKTVAALNNKYNHP
jgi:hypothetical protein